MEAINWKCGPMKIPVVTDGDRVLFPVKRICELLRLNWRSEVLKLRPPSFSPVHVDVHASALDRRPLCLETRDFKRWVESLEDLGHAKRACEALRSLQYRAGTRPPRLHTDDGRNFKPSEILIELARWQLQKFPKESQDTLLISLERQFESSFGCSLWRVEPERLASAIDVLATMLFQLDQERNSTSTEHLDFIFERLITTIGHGVTRTNRADIAAITCALEKSIRENLLA